MTTYLGKSCSFGLPRVPFVNCRHFMYLVISLLVLRAGCGIWLYQFLIIAYLFTYVNIIVYAKFHHNIPLSSRDRAIFTFSEFKPRQRLGRFQMIFDNPLGYILVNINAYAKFLTKYSKRFKRYRYFSRTGRGQNLHKQSKDKVFTNCPVTKSNNWL